MQIAKSGYDTVCFNPADGLRVVQVCIRVGWGMRRIFQDQQKSQRQDKDAEFTYDAVRLRADRKGCPHKTDGLR